MEGTSSTATWPVLHGTLGSCISLESSLSTLDPNSAVSDPLLLQRPPSNAPPCDITIVFPKRHEIRQIYVRSTARIYEIYYATNSKSSNEYLCTVRCSLVQQDANENETQFLGETSSRSSNTSTSEESWVDVTKTSPDSNISKINVSPPRTKEELYEATAEISDAEPCISLTLRLLSIQSDGYVCVDEIYVYGDPVDEDGGEEQKNLMGSAAGSSLMALLAPTLLQLQLSKSGMNSTENNFNSKQPKEPSSNGIGSQGADLNAATNESLPEFKTPVSSQQVTQDYAGSAPANAAEPTKSHVPLKVPDVAVSHNITTSDHPSRIEQALNELISRVIKIEDTCSRFEENMRKPICSIEERLSRVESQLSVLTKNSQTSKLVSGTRFSAPDYSCTESASNSSDVDESNPTCGTSNTIEVLPAQLRGIGSSISMETVDVPPSLSSTPLQHATHDTEDTDPPLPIRDFSEQPKKTVSIDDALASALAAFMSSGHSQTLNKGFSIKAPEYSTSEESENNNAHSSVSHSAENSSVVSEGDTEVSLCKESSPSISIDVVHKVQADHCFLENDPSTDQVEQDNEANSFRKVEVEGTSQLMNSEDPSVKESDESCSSDKFEGGVQYTSDGYDGHKIVGNDDTGNIEYTFGEDAHSNDSLHLRMEHEVGDDQQKARIDKEATNQEALLQVTELALKPSPVNFDTSVLDVMFVSGRISSTSSPLEALLTDTEAGCEVEAPCDAEVGNRSDATTDDDFISVEKATSILDNTDSFVNMHHFDLETTNLIIDNRSAEIETVKNLQSSLIHEVFPASLI